MAENSEISMVLVALTPLFFNRFLISIASTRASGLLYILKNTILQELVWMSHQSMSHHKMSHISKICAAEYFKIYLIRKSFSRRFDPCVTYRILTQKILTSIITIRVYKGGGFQVEIRSDGDNVTENFNVYFELIQGSKT